MMKQFCGFTLIELLIAVVVLGLMLTMGVPSMAGFMKNSRVKGQAYEFIHTINFARSEAIKRKERVVLCRSANPTAANPTWVGTATNCYTGGTFF